MQADSCIVYSDCSVIHNHDKLVNVCSCNPTEGHKNAKTVDAEVWYDDPIASGKYSFMFNHVIYDKDLTYQLVFPMYCHLNVFQ